MDEMIDAKVANAFKRYLHEKETIEGSGTGSYAGSGAWA